MEQKLNNVQDSCVIIKPYFANNPVIIEYVKTILTEQLGLKIKEEAYLNYDKEDAKKHYDEHKERNFFGELVDYLSSDVCYAMVVSGENAIAKIREVVGKPMKYNKETGEYILPEPGTIRYDVPVMLGEAHRMTENVIHASDKPESAKKEIAIMHEVARKKQMQ